MVKTLFIRVDATYNIGTGHFMRCLALAQAWQSIVGEVYFLMAGGEHLEERIKSEGMHFKHINYVPGSSKDVEQLIKLSEKLHPDWILLDGYHFDTKYQKRIKEQKLNLLYLDDAGKHEHYYSDIVLNQNLHAKKEYYARKEPYTKLLLGTDFVLLRKEFIEWIDWDKEIKDIADHFLVTLGGSDEKNYSQKIIQALNGVHSENLKIIVLIGVNNPHKDELNRTIEQSRHKIDLIRNVRDMPQIMAWSDLAFSSGGITVWEMAYMGLPTIVGATSYVEELLINGLQKNNLFLTVGKINDNSQDHLTRIFQNIIENKEKRERMSARGKLFIDGHGCDRVISTMLNEVDKNE